MTTEPAPMPPTSMVQSAAGEPHTARAGETGEPTHGTTPRRKVLQIGLLLAWVVAGVALVATLLLWQRVSNMQMLLARQNADAGSQSVEARALARQADEAVRANAAKVAALEGRVADMTAYRMQLEELAQSVARARDENLAVELESALRVAQDQAQLTGSVEPLLAALRTAERRLARSADPRLAPAARAVARDLERVKTAAVTDSDGLLARIDQLLRQVDDLPLANSVGKTRGAVSAQQSASNVPASWWARTWRAFLQEAEGLLRVSRIDRPEATMLSPEQSFFVRENLKLRLQGARLGILARQYESARADLGAAAIALGSWFDPASRRTQATATLLQQVQAQTKSAEFPRVSESLAALGSAVAAASAATQGK